MQVFLFNAKIADGIFFNKPANDNLQGSVASIISLFLVETDDGDVSGGLVTGSVVLLGLLLFFVLFEFTLWSCQGSANYYNYNNL